MIQLMVIRIIATNDILGGKGEGVLSQRSPQPKIKDSKQLILIGGMHARLSGCPRLIMDNTVANIQNT